MICNSSCVYIGYIPIYRAAFERPFIGCVVIMTVWFYYIFSPFYYIFSPYQGVVVLFDRPRLLKYTAVTIKRPQVVILLYFFAIPGCRCPIRPSAPFEIHSCYPQKTSGRCVANRLLVAFTYVVLDMQSQDSPRREIRP